jgi:hypothetical protein
MRMSGVWTVLMSGALLRAARGWSGWSSHSLWSQVSVFERCFAGCLKGFRKDVGCGLASSDVKELSPVSGGPLLHYYRPYRRTDAACAEVCLARVSNCLVPNKCSDICLSPSSLLTLSHPAVSGLLQLPDSCISLLLGGSAFRDAAASVLVQLTQLEHLPARKAPRFAWQESLTAQHLLACLL